MLMFIHNDMPILCAEGLALVHFDELLFLYLQLFQRGLNLQARLLTSGVVEQLHRYYRTAA